jgi:hypothetical protein
MMLTTRRSSLIGFIILAVGLVGFSALLLLKSETQRRETRFSEYVQNISGIVHNRLDTNEAVLAGFSAFLQAVDQSDTDAAARYAAAVLSAYPHIYMLEAARAVPIAEQAAFEILLRRTWRPDFELKDFPSLTQQPAQHQVSHRDLACAVYVPVTTGIQFNLWRQVGNRRLSFLCAGSNSK